MKENDLVTLDDDKKYVLLNEIEVDAERKYFLAAEVKDEGIDFKSSLFFKAGIDEEGEYLDDVVDPEEIKELLLLITTKEVVENNPEYASEIEKIIEQMGS